MTLKMDTLLADGVTIVACTGRIVFGEEASGLRESLKKLLETTKRIVLNLSGVTYIDSGGLGTLVGVYSSARAQGVAPPRAARTTSFQAWSSTMAVWYSTTFTTSSRCA